jgi:hypothetical protein
MTRLNRAGRSPSCPLLDVELPRDGRDGAAVDDPERCRPRILSHPNYVDGRPARQPVKLRRFALSQIAALQGL